MDLQLRDVREVALVPSDEHQIMHNCRRGNENIRLANDLPLLADAAADSGKSAKDGTGQWKDGDAAKKLSKDSLGSDRVPAVQHALINLAVRHQADSKPF